MTADGVSSSIMLARQHQEIQTTAADSLTGIMSPAEGIMTVMLMTVAALPSLDECTLHNGYQLLPITEATDTQMAQTDTTGMQRGMRQMTDSTAMTVIRMIHKHMILKMHTGKHLMMPTGTAGLRVTQGIPTGIAHSMVCLGETLRLSTCKLKTGKLLTVLACGLPHAPHALICMLS